MSGLANESRKKKTARSKNSSQRKASPSPSTRLEQAARASGIGSRRGPAKKAEKSRPTAPSPRMTGRKKSAIAGAASLSAALHPALADAMQDAIFAVDRDDRILYANAAAGQFFGVPAGALIGRDRASLFPAAIAARQKRAIDSVFASGQVFASETQFPYPNSELWTSTVLSPIRNADGEVVAVLGLARNIEKMKQAEQALQQSEARYRSVVEGSLQGLSILQGGRMVFVNAAMCEMLGRSAEVLQSLSAEEILAAVHPDDRTASLERDAARARGEPAPNPFEYRVLCPDGTIRWLASYLTHIDFEGHAALLSSTIDITDRKAAEQAARLSEERLRALIESSSDGIMLIDPGGNALYASPAARQIFGVPAEELLGQNMFQWLHPEDVELASRALGSLLEKPGARVNIVLRVHNAQRGTRWLEVTGSNLLDDPSVGAILGNYRDITESRQIEQALRESEQRYRTLVGNLPGMAYRCLDDETWTMEFLSEGCRVLTGYSPEDFMQNQTVNYDQITHPDDRQRIRDEIQAAIARDDSYELTYRILRADGEERSVWERGRAVGRAKDGHAILEGFITDITDLVQRQRALETLHAGGLTLSRSLDPREIGQAIIGVLEERLDWHHAAVRLRLEGTDQIELLAFSEPHTHASGRDPGEETARSRISRLGEGLSGWVIAHGETVRSGELSRDPRYVAVFQDMVSGLYVPIQAGERTIGCISVEDEHPNSFSAEDERLLTTLASQAAVALENARLLEEARRRADEFAALYETTRDIAAQQDVHRILQTVVERAAQLLHVPMGGIYLYDATHDELEVAVNVGLPSSLGVRVAVGEGAAGRVAATRKPLIIDDYQTWEGRSGKYKDVPFRAVLEVPMIYSGELLGVLTVNELGDSQRKFTEADAYVLSLFASTAAGAVYSARLFDQLEQRLQQLSALHSIDMVISASTDLRVNLKVILETAQRQLKADAVSVLLLNPVTLNLEYTSGVGFETPEISRSVIRLGEGAVGRIALTKETLILPNVRLASPEFLRSKLVDVERFVSYVGVPLVAKGQVKGILEVYHRAPFEANPDWLSFLNLLSSQTAIAMDNSLLFENLERANAELTLAYDATIEGWSQALELRGSEPRGHGRRVVERTLKLAQLMGVREREMQRIRHGALLHDIGVMGIPDEILHKPAPLSEAEWAIMRRHPQYAYDLLSPIIYLRPALEIPYSHHEKWDGTGYPRGLKGESIPLAARVFAVVDVYDALTSDRPYRQAWPHEQVIDYIRAQAGAHFDPTVADAFLQMIRSEKGD